MNDNWKPGDIAMVHGDVCIFLGRDRGWEHGREDRFAYHEGKFPARRLVVIDPEDREQVERLAKAMHESDHIAPWHDLHNETRAQMEDAMQAALREFANPTPPKPEEPTGLGAVVDAINDNRFVRVGPAGWVHVDDCAGIPCDWDDIAVVRVISEGLTP